MFLDSLLIVFFCRIQRIGIPQINAKRLLLSTELFKCELLQIYIRKEEELIENLKKIALDEISAHITGDNLSLMHRTFGRSLDVSTADLTLCLLTRTIVSQYFATEEPFIISSSFVMLLRPELEKLPAEHLGMLALVMASIAPPARLSKPGT